MSDIFPRTFFPTACMSYPRSGHHALVEVLRAYFKENFHYCELYRNPPTELLLGAPGSPTNYVKNHDFNLETPILSDRNYLVQVRNPLAAIESWDELDRRVGHRTPDSQEKKLDFWTAFVKKWVFGPVPSRLVVWYEDLLRDPPATTTSVIQFLTKTQNVDNPLLEECLRKFPLSLRTQTRPTRYTKA